MRQSTTIVLLFSCVVMTSTLCAMLLWVARSERQTVYLRAPLIIERRVPIQPSRPVDEDDYRQYEGPRPAPRARPGGYSD